MRTLKPMALALALIAGTGLSLVACQPQAEPTTMSEPTTEAVAMPEPTMEVPTMEPATEITETTAMTSPLDGPTWVLVSHGDPVSPTMAVSGTRVTANFAEGRVSGNGGCNVYGGDFTVDGDSLTVGMTVGTMMFCEPQEVMDQEQAYLALLGAAAHFSVSEEALTITTTDSMVLNYSAQAPASLEGGAWTLLNYNNGQEAVVSVTEGVTITATFDGSQVTGFGGCNNYFAGYTVDGNSITIDAPGSTMMACDQAVMDQEAAFLAALASAAAWRIDGETLAMRTADDAMAVNFTRVMTDTTATE